TSLSGFSQSICTAWEMQPGSPRERRPCSRLNLRTSSNVSGFAVTLPVTTIMLPPVLLLFCRNCGGRQIDRLLRPALQRGAAGVAQHIDAALGAVEPAIDIVQQHLAGVGNVGAQIAHA